MRLLLLAALLSLGAPSARAAAPVSPVLTGAFLSSATASWGDVTPDGGYVLEASTAPDFSGSADVSSITAANDATSLALTGLESNATYYFRAGAVFSGTTDYAATSPASTTTLAAAAAAPAWAGAGPHTIALSWENGGNRGGDYPGPWTVESGALPAARDRGALAAWGGRLYFSGGLVSAAPQATVWTAAVSTGGRVGGWTETTPLPEARESHTMTAWEGRLYVVGGFKGSGKDTVWRAVIGEDGTLGDWETDRPLPSARFRHGAAAVDGYLYVLGGDNGIFAQSTVYRARIAEDGSLGPWGTTAALPAALNNHAVAVSSGRIYVTGGLGVGVASTIYRAVPAAGVIASWTTEAQTLPGGRFRHAAAADRDRIYVIGGYDGSQVRTEVFSARLGADGTVGAWTGAEGLPAGRFQHGAAYLRGALYAAGGSDGGDPVSTVWSARLEGTEYLVETARDAGFTTDLGSGSWRPGTVYAASGLTPNAVYFARVRARGRDGTLTAPILFGSTVTHAAQPASAASTFTAVWRASMTVAWGAGANPGGTEFSVEAATSADFGGSAAASAWAAAVTADLTGLSLNTSYYIRARARSSAGLTTPYRKLGSTYTAATEPTGSVFDSVQTTGFTIEWAPDGNPGWTRYEAQVSTDPAFDPLSASSVTVSTQASFVGLVSQTTFYVRVRGLNGNGVPTLFDSVLSTSTGVDLVAPGVSTGTADQGGPAGGLRLSWQVSGDDGNTGDLLAGSTFFIQWSTDPVQTVAWSTSSAQIVLSTGPAASGATASVLVEDLPSGNTVSFRLWTSDESGNFSEPSAAFGALTAPFSLETVDGGGPFRGDTALAFSRSGVLHAAYYDAGSGSVLYRRRSGTVWGAPETVDAGAGAGTVRLQLAVGPDEEPRLAYFNEDGTRGLRFAVRSAGTWSRYNAASPSANTSGISAAMDPAGISYVAFADGAALKVAISTTGVNWTTETVDVSRSDGPSLAMAGDGIPWVSYGGSGGLYAARRTGPSSWSVETVDESGAASRTSLALDGEGEPRIAYLSGGGAALKVSSRAAGAWSPRTVESGSAGEFADPSLALDGTGAEHLSYRRAGAYDDLKYAWWLGSGWSTFTVDSFGRPGPSGTASLALSKDGDPDLLYLESDSEDLRSARWGGAGFTAPFGGSARGRAQAPHTLYGLAASSTSIQWLWYDGSDGEDGFRLYGADGSTGPYSLIAGTQTIAAAVGAGSIVSYVETGLQNLTTYFRYVAAVGAGGVAASSAAFSHPDTSEDTTPPTIIVNQTGDPAWRRDRDAGYYDVDFVDIGGAGLHEIRVKASTVPGGGGADLTPFTTVAFNLSGDTFNTDWQLPQTVFDALLEGVTNYISVEALDDLGNSTSTVDAFYVLKDTTPPSLRVPLSGDDAVRASSGTVYDVDAAETGSALAYFRYSASLLPASADGSVIASTDVAVVSSWTAYTSDWEVMFESLVSGTTNYISVLAADLAGNTTEVVSAFHVVKDTEGPTTGLTAPLDPFISTLAAIAGTASDWTGVAGVEVSVELTTASKYWNGTGFTSGTRVWVPVSCASGSWRLELGGVWESSGAYRIVARASDTVGNYSDVYSTGTFVWDVSIPTAAVSYPGNGATVTALAAVSGTAADSLADSGIGSVELELRRLSDGLWWNFFSETWVGTENSSAAAGGESWTYAPTELLKANLRDGASYYLTVRAADSAVSPNQGGFFAQGSTFTFQDPGAPSAVTTLSALFGANAGEIRLSWTAPGDDGDAGTILSGQYRVGYSTVSSVTDADFSTTSAQVAISTGGVEAGRCEVRILSMSDGLSPGSTYYLRLWTRDDEGNWSALSNGVTTFALPSPISQIIGTVMNSSSEPIQAVQLDCWDAEGTYYGSDFSDSSGAYSLAGLPAGKYRVQAAWTVGTIQSSVWQDNIEMGTAQVDFMLEVDVSLGALTGTMLSLASRTGAAPGFVVRAEDHGFEGSRVELFRGGREVARTGVGPAGRWTLAHLLPGEYAVRAFNGFEYSPLKDVEVLEGETQEVSFFYDPLPEKETFAFPNPARESATVRFRSPLAPLEAQVLVFDISGELVREIPGDRMSSPSPGIYHADWDLTNMRGEGVASGVYLFVVKVKGSNGQSAKVIKKLAVVK